MSENIIHVEDLTMSYNEKPVIWDVDLDILKRSRTAIIGPNGAGKSTLLKAILGLVKPVSGYVEIEGKRNKEERSKIAYIPQTGNVNWDFPATVFETVLMGRYVHLGWFKRPKKEDKNLALKALEEMEMTEFKNRQISQLSGGQKQRVFIARAICQNAEIYIMDEPLAGVDRKTENIILKKIMEFQNNGKTVVAVHHDLNTVNKFFDHVVLLNKTIIATGPTAEVFNRDNLYKAYGGDVYYGY